MKPWSTHNYDCWAFWLPIFSAFVVGVSAVVSIIGGDELTAILTVLGAVLSAVGVWATNKASKLRDDQMNFLIAEQLRQGQTINNMNYQE